MSDQPVAPAVTPLAPETPLGPAAPVPTPSSQTPGPDHLADNGGPVISPKVRSGVYIGCLIINVLTVVGFGLGIVFGLVQVEQATSAGSIIIGGINIVSAGLGVAYRPTRDGINAA